MKTNFFFSAIAAIVLSASFSFSASAAESDVASNNESSVGYTVMNRTDRVYSHNTDIWSVTLLAGEEYVIVVDGDGDTDLDLYVYDENGNEIDCDTDYTDYCLCTVKPIWTGDFKIKIKNYGDVYNEYQIRITR